MLKKILVSASIFTIAIHCVNAMDMPPHVEEHNIVAIRDQFENFNLLPEELQEDVLKEMMTSRDVGFISSFPAVCKRWNFFINSPVITKWLLKQPLRGLYEERHKIFPVRQLQTAGAKQYRCIGEQIIDCSKEGDIEGIKKLLENPYANIDYVTRIKFNKHYFQTPLVIACLKGNLELVDFLLAHGSDQNKQCQTDPKVYFLCAPGVFALNGAGIKYPAEPKVECLAKLCKKNAKVNEVYTSFGTNSGVTFLHQAVNPSFCKAMPEIIHLLLDHGTIVNQKSDIIGTPLHCLLTFRHGYTPDKRLLTILMDKGKANPHIEHCGESAYDLAKVYLSIQEPEYLNIIRAHDKGRVWYGRQELEKKGL